MKIVEGDLLQMPGVKCVTTNGVIKGNGEAVMGAGIALKASKANPWMPRRLGHLITQHGNRTFNLGHGWVALPTKHHWRQDSDLDLIKTSCQQLVSMADKFGWTDVYLPAPGVGMGNLNWDSVHAILDEILDDRFTVVLYRKKA